MQNVRELFSKLTTERPDVSVATINQWIEYLCQLKDCRLFSAISQDVNEAEWLQVRTAGIGGSDIAAIMGNNPWSSPRQIWLSKTKQFATEAKMQSEQARWGNLLETVVATEWGIRNNRQWIAIPVTLQSIEYPWMLANIDGFTLSDDRSTITGILEIKTTTEYNKDVWEYGPIPHYYMCQTNWYCTVTGLDNYVIACLVGGQALYSYDMLADMNLRNEMLEAGKVFWLVNVKDMIEPELSHTDLDALRDTAGIDEEAPPIIIEDDESERLAESYVLIRDKMSELEKVKKALYAQLFGLLGNSRQALTQTRTITLQLTSRRKCDLELLQGQYPEAYASCVSTNVSKSLRIK